MENNIDVLCPQCKRRLIVPPDSVGKKVRCGGCHYVFVAGPMPGPIPGPPQPQAPWQPPRPQPAMPPQFQAQSPQWPQAPPRKPASRSKIILIPVGAVVVAVFIVAAILILVLWPREKSAEKIFAETKNSVVVVGKGMSGGTGFAIERDDWIITNYHVIDEESSDPIIVAQINSDGDNIQLDMHKKVTVIYQDYEKDLAILKVEGAHFKPLRLAAAGDCRTGMKVLAIGNPSGGGGTVLANTMTEGIVSNATCSRGSSVYIQTSAAVNPGNSGGPLLNMYGQVIGIITLKIMGADNIGFAIPVDDIEAALKEARKNDAGSGKNK